MSTVPTQGSFFSPFANPFTPVRLTGGGDDHQLLRPDTEMVDVFSAEEITSARPLFNPEEWIATGKIWSATLPLHVRLAFADEQNVPTWMKDRMPQPQVQIATTALVEALEVDSEDEEVEENLL